MKSGLRWIGLAALAGCYRPAPQGGATCGTSRVCPDGLHCVGEPGTCESSETDAAREIDACPGATCVGSDLVGCDSTITCNLGCLTAPQAHCGQLVPSNGVTTALLAGATADVNGATDWTFFTDNGEIRKGNVTLRPAGTGIVNGIGFTVVDTVGVFTAHSFTQNGGDIWSAAGTHPLTLFAATTIVVNGQIEARGGQFSSAGAGGTGGNLSTTTGMCHGRAGRLLSTNHGEGGGGGGGAQIGGAGGASNGGASSGIGGMVCSSPSTIPLRGGWGGGAGGASSNNPGGGGGGGISLVAMDSITVAASAAVGTPGGGGISTLNGEGGGGGGGGGAVLLEAPMVTLHGALTAGGGGGAAPSDGDGNNGSLTTTGVAQAGVFTGPGGTVRGGTGGTNALPGAGQNYTYDDGLGTVISRGGGGGGAAGRLEIKARTMDVTPSIQSPTAAQSDAVIQ